MVFSRCSGVSWFAAILASVFCSSPQPRGRHRRSARRQWSMRTAQRDELEVVKSPSCNDMWRANAAGRDGVGAVQCRGTESPQSVANLSDVGQSDGVGASRSARVDNSAWLSCSPRGASAPTSNHR